VIAGLDRYEQRERALIPLWRVWREGRVVLVMFDCVPDP
jgi:hypothetical protein